MNKKQLILRKKKEIVLGVLALAIIAVIFYTGDRQKEGPKIAEETKKCRDLRGTGKQTFDILTDKPNKLQIMQISVDPIDVKEGEMQTITVKVKDDNNDTITRESGVTAKIQTDNKNINVAFVLRLATDTEDNSALLSTWEGSWIKEDTTCSTYTESITVTNDKGDEHFIDLSFK